MEETNKNTGPAPGGPAPGSAAGGGAGGAGGAGGLNIVKIREDRNLIEGVDFDEMGPEVYSDPYVRVVGYGGIPIYTAVGYTGNSSNITYDDICGPGNGLKTFDRIYSNKYELKLQNKALQNKFNRNKYTSNKNITNTYDTLENIFKYTKNMNNKEKRRTLRYKLYKSGVRFNRFKRDPKYGTHIYFRAPGTWPHIQNADKTFSLKPDLKGIDDIRDFNRSTNFSSLLGGAEEHESAELGVIIRVDPNNTYVFNSMVRVTDAFTDDIIYNSSIKLSEYLLRLKEGGIGFCEYDSEIYITPPDGIFPSEKFYACLNTDGKNIIIKKKSDDTSEVYDVNERKIPDLKKLFEQIGLKQHNKRTTFIKDLSLLYYLNINELQKHLFFFESIDDNTVEEIKKEYPESIKIIKFLIQYIKKGSITIIKNCMTEIRKKIYPYLIISLQLPSEELIKRVNNIIKEIKINIAMYYNIDINILDIITRTVKYINENNIKNSNIPAKKESLNKLIMKSPMGLYLIKIMNLFNPVPSKMNESDLYKNFLNKIPDLRSVLSEIKEGSAPITIPIAHMAGEKPAPIAHMAEEKPAPASTRARARAGTKRKKNNISNRTNTKRNKPAEVSSSAAAGGGGNSKQLTNANIASLKEELQKLSIARQTRKVTNRKAEIQKIFNNHGVK